MNAQIQHVSIGDSFVAEFSMPLNLGVGNYSLTIALHPGWTHLESNYDWWDQCLVFQVIPGDSFDFIGIASLPVEVTLKKDRHKTDRSKKRSASHLGSKDVVNWMDIALKLKTADENTDVGLKQLPLLRFPRSIRWFAKLVEKVILYVTQVVTIPQRHYNRAVLDSLHIMLEAMRDSHEYIRNIGVLP